MFARANDLVARAARLFVPASVDTGLWTISGRGRSGGAPVRLDSLLA
jgi:hypothetical protein